MSKSMENELEELLSNAFNEVQDNSSSITLGFDPPDMTWAKQAILNLIEKREVEARIEELEKVKQWSPNGENIYSQDLNLYHQYVTLSERIAQLKKGKE